MLHLQLPIWIFLFKLINICDSGRINCPNFQDPICFSKTINCVQDEQDCVVTCGSTNGHNESCRDSTINCAPDVGCYVHCLTFRSCQNIVINGGNANTLAVYSANTGQEVLNNAQINCQNVEYCDIKCTENLYQCRNSVINAENAGQLILRCEGSNQWTYHCYGLDIFCPRTQQRCWIFSPNVLSQADIYSEFGFAGVQLCGNAYVNSNSNSNIGTIHCGSQYDTSCIINANGCRRRSQTICAATNTVHGAISCDIPLFVTTRNPTIYPISDSTITPSLYVSTTHPTANSLHNFTSYPTYEDIKMVTKTVVVFTAKAAPVFNKAGFMAIMVLLGLICCIMICIIALIHIKTINKNNVMSVADDDKNNVNELERQQLKQQNIVPINMCSINGNNGLILYRTNGSMEGNIQSIANVNNDLLCDDESEDNNELYEGQSEPCKLACTAYNMDSRQPSISEALRSDISDMEIYGPGFENKTNQ